MSDTSLLFGLILRQLRFQTLRLRPKLDWSHISSPRLIPLGVRHCYLYAGLMIFSCGRFLSFHMSTKPLLRPGWRYGSCTVDYKQLYMSTLTVQCCSAWPKQILPFETVDFKKNSYSRIILVLKKKRQTYYISNLCGK